MSGLRTVVPDSSCLLLVGGSVRFLAESCRGAGWRVHAVDRFGDADLMAVAESHRFLATDLEQAGDPLSGLPQAACLFTGGLENAPQLLEVIAASRLLAAAPSAAIRAVRDPRRLAELAADASLGFPETHLTPQGLPIDGSFLVKPLTSAGGHGIAAWRGGGRPPSPSVWQRLHHGVPHGVSLVLEPGAAPRLLGVARAPRCREAAGASEWAYFGSVTTAPPAWTDRVLDLAALAATRHGLRGAVGIDCLADDAGRVVVLEINPRPTASMELFERTAGISIAAVHLAAFGIRSPRATIPRSLDEPPPGPTDNVSPQASRRPAAGKAILFAPLGLHVTPAFDRAIRECAARWSLDPPGLAAVADLPRESTRIASGHPLLTVFAEADDPDAVDQLLEARLEAVRGICLSQPPGEAWSSHQPAADTASDRHLRCCPDRSS